MNAVRNMLPTECGEKITVSNISLSLVSNEKQVVKNELERMTKDYLNEKLSYFYSHGGPIMDI